MADDVVYITVEEAAKLTGFKIRTVYEHVRNNTWPHIKIGRAVRFNRTDLIAFIEGFRVSTIYEIEAKASLMHRGKNVNGLQMYRGRKAEG